MRLKKLVLQGFKSFRNKTTVYFDNGVTGIVGPNGCGKSNIVDALFWVMGEQSAKHLRGLSMKDLIFSGSSGYGPGAFAEVSLLLDNEEGKHIHLGKKVLTAPREIQISRKLYRSGDSEYRINGLPVRLRDIQEIFMDTGAGAKSYSIIAQGEIERLVQAKPQERRAMVEEVAGITKFKLRRKESCRKIEQTQVNLGRIKDLETEVYKNMKSLRKQAERAERGRSLREKIERADLMVSSHKEYDLLNNFKKSSQFVKEKEFEIIELETKKKSLEMDIEESNLRKISLNQEIDDRQRKFNDRSRELAGDEEKLNYMRETQGEKISFMEMKVAENVSILKENEGKKNLARELSNQYEDLERLELEGDAYAKEAEEVERLRGEVESQERDLGELRTDLNQNQKSFFEQERELLGFKSRINELIASIESISVEIKSIEQKHSAFSHELSNDRDKVNRAKEGMDESEKNLKQTSSDYWSAYDTKKRLEKEVNGLTKDIVQGEARLQSFFEIQRERAAQDNVSKKIIREFPEICSLLGESITYEREEDRYAFEAVLKIWTNAIVLKKGCPDDILTWLAQEKLGAKILLPQPQTDAGSPNMVSLASRVEVKDERIQTLLEGVYLIDSVSEDLLQDFSGQNFSLLVCRDGSGAVENVGGAFKIWVFGSETNASFINDEVSVQLREKIIEFKEELSGKETELDEVKSKIKTIAQKKDSLENEVSLKKVEYASLDSALNTNLSNLDSGESRLTILQGRIQEFSREQASLLEKKELVESGYKSLKTEIDKKVNLEREGTHRLSQLRLEYDKLNEKFLIKKVEYKSRNNRLEFLKNQLENQKIELERNLKKLAENSELISRYEKDLETIGQNMGKLGRENTRRAFELQEMEKDLNDTKGKFSELLSDIHDKGERIKKISTNVSENEKDIAVKEAKIEQIISEEDQIQRNIFEKYRVDLRHDLASELNLSGDDLAQFSDVSDMYFSDQLDPNTEELMRVKINRKSYQFDRKYGQHLKDQKEKLKKYKQALRQIGEVNWQAVEDYERQKLRHQFLKQQKEELQASISDLEEAIAQIDEKSKSKFKQAFQEVNIRFEKVFPLIFGGGSARLKLVGDMEDSDCGVDIIAQPPGKKMQNVNLMSGGEKALTAVSLIFSIFLVKPSPFCLLDEVDAPLDDANVGRFNELLSEMSNQSQFILITHNKKTMEFNDTLYGITMQEPGISTAVSVQLQ